MSGMCNAIALDAKWIDRIVSIGVLAFVIGCDSVVIDEPFGEPLTKEANAKFVGIWQEEFGDRIEIRQRSDGQLVCGTLEWNSELGKFDAKNEDLETRRLGTETYVFIKGSSGKRRFFARIESIGKDEVWMRVPDSDRFRVAVEKDAVEGKVESLERSGFVVVLPSDSAQVLQILKAETSSDLFLDESVKLRRVRP